MALTTTAKTPCAPVKAPEPPVRRVIRRVNVVLCTADLERAPPGVVIAAYRKACADLGLDPTLMKNSFLQETGYTYGYLFDHYF